ncbi:MAG: helix-turn-helix domain containing protein, partial [Eubacteriales bacterium]|nr:helix-turn-helix domain containing protein [Eubacteriales bacterium]
MQNYQWLDELLEKEMPNMTEKKKAIVKAALILFSEKGYAATSTKEIAVMANVSEGTIFKHFSSKRELMLSLIDIIINEMLLTLFYTGLPEILS